MVELTDRQKITELISVKPMDAQSLSRAIEFQIVWKPFYNIENLLEVD